MVEKKSGVRSITVTFLFIGLAKTFPIAQPENKNGNFPIFAISKVEGWQTFVFSQRKKLSRDLFRFSQSAKFPARTHDLHLDEVKSYR